MSFPVDYLKDPVTTGYVHTRDHEEAVRIRAWLDERDLVATRVEGPFAGQVARVKIDVFGESAAEVEATLLAYGARCDAALQALSCSYGETVIERNLEERWGATYSWRGRMTLHPEIGTIESSQRAKNVVAQDDAKL